MNACRAARLAGPGRAGGAARTARAARTPRPCIPAAVAGLLVLLAAVTGHAQLPWLEPLPAWSAADTLASRAFALDISRLADGRTGWTADRVAAELRFAAGGRGFFFARLPWLRLDTGDLPALERWPGIRGVEAGAGWPGEAVLAGFGQLELGAAGPVRLPLAGTLAAALGVGVPLGHSRFYPLSSSGLPLRLEATRRVTVSGRWSALAGAGLVRHGGPGDEVLDETAFPDGRLLRLGLGWSSGPVIARLDWTAEARGDRRAQWLAAEWSAPWGDGARAGARVAREVSGSGDRPAAWLAGVTWRLLPRPAAAVPAMPAMPGAGPTRP